MTLLLMNDVLNYIIIGHVSSFSTTQSPRFGKISDTIIYAIVIGAAAVVVILLILIILVLCILLQKRKKRYEIYI